MPMSPGEVERALRHHDVEIVQVYDTLVEHTEALERIEARLLAHDARFDQVDQRFDQVDERLGHLDAQVGEVLAVLRSGGH